MKYLVAILIPLLLLLQYALWFGDGGVLELWRLKQSIEKQVEENDKLRERNEALAGEVRDLKKGLEALEERARSEMGMIGKEETFFQIVDETSEKR